MRILQEQFLERKYPCSNNYGINFFSHSYHLSKHIRHECRQKTRFKWANKSFWKMIKENVLLIFVTNYYPLKTLFIISSSHSQSRHATRRLSRKQISKRNFCALLIARSLLAPFSGDHMFLVTELQSFPAKRMHPCPTCNRTFKRKNSLSRHLLYVCGQIIFRLIAWLISCDVYINEQRERLIV